MKELNIYTDGSIKNGKAAWAFVVNHNIFFSGCYPTGIDNIFQVETRAIYEAIRWINNELIDVETVIIHCDSKSVVNACKSKFTEPRNKYWKLIIESRSDVQFEWIRRYSNEQTEFADNLCKTEIERWKGKMAA